MSTSDFVHFLSLHLLEDVNIGGGPPSMPFPSFTIWQYLSKTPFILLTFLWTLHAGILMASSISFHKITHTSKFSSLCVCMALPKRMENCLWLYAKTLESNNPQWWQPYKCLLYFSTYNSSCNYGYVHQKLTEKLVLRDRTWCHHLGGMYNISPCFRWHSHATAFS